MTALMLVVVALGGVCAYVWRLIVQAETQQEGSAARIPARTRGATGGLVPWGAGTFRELRSRLRRLDAPRRAVVRLRLVAAALATIAGRAVADARARKARRAELTFEVGPRRPRFEETAELTLPRATGREHRSGAGGWAGRPSRLQAALELVLLVVLLGGAVAAGIIGAVQLIGRTFSFPFGG